MDCTLAAGASAARQPPGSAVPVGRAQRRPAAPAGPFSALQRATPSRPGSGPPPVAGGGPEPGAALRRLQVLAGVGRGVDRPAGLLVLPGDQGADVDDPFALLA